MSSFGIQAYFAFLPSAWLAPAVNRTDGTLEMYLTYSADWSYHSDPGNPKHEPASSGNWLVQHVRLGR